ncbi:hypothetical protein [Paenibacillus tengchongensis]|uniref:hypothetical protein n=1 Tax=Paenibacillus tengchongensis TaxID=2608684 RepID=UPI00124D3B43|nr:hypothetical protein [Paenibacillus tengchongensis]
MHKRSKAFVLLLLSTFAVSPFPGLTTGTVAEAASAAAVQSAVQTQVSTLAGLSAMKLGSSFSVKLSDVGIFAQEGGNILTYTLTYTNTAGTSVNLANYFSKVVTPGGSIIKGVTVSADAQTKKIAGKETKSITYYANIGQASSVKGLKVNMYGWNFNAADYEQRIGTFTVPANYSLAALQGESKKISLGSVAAATQASGLQIYNYNGKAYAKVGLTITNQGTKVLTDPGYSLYLKSAGGSVFTLALDESSSEFKIQPQEKKTLYFMTEIPAYMNTKNMTLQIAKLDETLKLYLPVVSYALPAAGTASFTVAAGYTKKVSIDSNIVEMQLLKSEVSADNGNAMWSYQFRIKNTGSKAVAVPAYEFSVKSAEGYTFPVTTTAFSNLTLKPLEEQVIALDASIPLELNQDKLQLQVVPPAGTDSASTNKMVLPVAYFSIPYTLQTNSHVASETSVTNSYGTFGVTLNSLQRLPWGSKDLLQAKLTIRNSTAKTVTLPELTGILKVDQTDLTSSSQVYTGDSSTTLSPGATTELTVLASMPYTLSFGQAKILLQAASGSETKPFLSLSTSDSAVTGIAPLAAGSSFTIASTGKKAEVKERLTTIYKGTDTNVVYTEFEMNSQETRQADLSRLYAQFRTADGKVYEAAVNQSEAATSPGGKTIVSFWAKIPASAGTSGLQLYVSQAIAGGKLTNAGTEATGYVNTSALTLNPAEITAASALTSVSMYPYTLAINSSSGEMTLGSSSLAISFNYKLDQDTTYQMGTYQHKLVMRVIDPFGQYFDKTLTLGTDLTAGSYNTYTTTLSNSLFKSLSGGSYRLELYDEFQGQRVLLGSQTYAINVTVKTTTPAADDTEESGTDNGSGSGSGNGS